MNTQPNSLRTLATVVLFAGLALATTGCRGGISTSPPVHLVQDMDFQPRYEAQAASKFFADGRTMRTPPMGTVPHSYSYSEGLAPEADSIAAAERLVTLGEYKDVAGNFVTKNPLEPSAAVLARGQERFGIYCAACHGLAGRGGFQDASSGPVGKRWPVAIPSFIEEPRVSALTDGELFNVITNGAGTMPAYGHMVRVEDRWSIIHYVRALQFQAENQ